MTTSSIQQSAANNRAAHSQAVSKPATDFYGGIGWIAGLLLTLFVSIPVVWFLTAAAPGSTRLETLTLGIAIAWWLNPLSLGALFYIFSNLRVWRFWTIFGLLVWGVINALVSLSIASESARLLVTSGLIILFYIILGLFILYIQLRVFVWAASGKPGRFFFGILGWAALNGLVYWALVNP
ncbi:MAG TPA: hypothetical protein VJ521_16245, partial [Acidobacteriota bacterium]|nr:hypothetical protein [Acidobacteriota bacterium]